MDHGGIFLHIRRQTTPNPLPSTAAGKLAHAMRFLRALVFTFGNLRGPQAAFVIAVARRVDRLAARFADLMRQFEAGTLPAPRPPRPRSRRGKPAAPPAFPAGFAWLRKWIPFSAHPAGQIEPLFDDRRLQALLAAAPQAGRILRPLCHMLGIRRPAILAPPARPAPPAPIAPATPSRAAPMARPPAARPPPHPFRSIPPISHLWGRWPPRKTT